MSGPISARAITLCCYDLTCNAFVSNAPLAPIATLFPLLQSHFLLFFILNPTYMPAYTGETKPTVYSETIGLVSIATNDILSSFLIVYLEPSLVLTWLLLLLSSIVSSIDSKEKISS